jgi:predicted amidophosphoribosyltransferase
MIICPHCNQPLEKTCENCKEKFYPKNENQRFCSNACRQKDFRIMQALGITKMPRDAF